MGSLPIDWHWAIEDFVLLSYSTVPLSSWVCAETKKS